MRALPLFACGLWFIACDAIPVTPTSKSAAPLVASGVMPVAPPQAVGPAEEDQVFPDIVAGPSGESLIVWADQRNFRFHQADLYGARVRNGVVLDPLGIPLVTGSTVEVEPSIAFDGTAYTLAWSTGDTVTVKGTRFASPLAPTSSRIIRYDASKAEVAAGGGHTLLVYRFNIGFPRGALLDDDLEVHTIGDGGTFFDFARSGSDYFSAGVVQAVWSPAQQKFFVVTTHPDSGLYLFTVDPLTRVASPPVRIAPDPISATNVGVELAAAPDGTLAVAWRSDTTISALLMPQPGVEFDGGTVLSTSGAGTPSITWSGSRFRVTVPNLSITDVKELFLDGGIADAGSFSAVASSCPGCPPFPVDGELLVATRSTTMDRFGADLYVQQGVEGAPNPTLARVTNSGRASHTPVSAFQPDGGTLIAYSTSDDAGTQRHDVAFRRFLPPNSLGPPTLLGLQDGTSPRLAWWADRWWLGSAFRQLQSGAIVGVHSSADQPLTFNLDLQYQGEGSPDLQSGWVVYSDRSFVNFRPLLVGGGVGPIANAFGAPTSPNFPDLAVDAQGRPVATWVEAPNLNQVHRTGMSGLQPTTLPLGDSYGDLRGAAVATNGTGFVAVYSTFDNIVMKLERRDVVALDDGGLQSVGAPVVLASGKLIETPSIAFARDQYLVTWSERDDIVLPSRLKMKTLKTDGGAGALVPLELGSVGNDGTARLAVNASQMKALLTWTRLDAADSGVPTGFMAQLDVGLSVSSICSSADQCTAGFCADGVCCETACAGGCGQCSSAGVCEPLGLGTPCQPVGECVVAAPVSECDGTLPDCPSMAGNEGLGCAADSGICQQGVCVPRGDAGVDAGPGSPDAGPPDAGEVDAGEVDAGPSDGGSSLSDGGVYGVAPPSNFSHYSWNQGCGCQGGGANVLVLLGLFLLRSRRTRKAGASLAAALALFVAVPANAQAPKSTRFKLSFPGVAAGAGARAEDANAIAEFLQTQLVGLDVYEVTGSNDIAALLGMERQKELLGCDLSCAVDIAGALNADRLLTSSLSKVGDSWLLTVSLYDARKSTPIFRASRRFTGSLEKALDAIDPMLAELISHDDAARVAAEATRPPPGSTSQWTVGMRAELEAMGIIDGQPAVAPAVFASWGRGMWGVALTVIVMLTPGVRAEGRLHLLESSKVRPLISAGVTVFGSAVAPRGSLGVTADVGPVRFSLDAAVEYYVSGPGRFQPLAVLTSAGVAWRF